MTNSRMTTNQGAPIGDNQNSRTAGSAGPTLLEDYHLLEKLAHFDRERIPERVVHARGAGAHGVFKTECGMSDYTRAAFLQEAGLETPVFVRFSTVIHGTGSPETARDPRGFAVKFYTQEGNYDLVGNHLPVFFIRDAIKFADMVHSLKSDPRSNRQEPGRYWDFMTRMPESTHMMTWLFSNHGTPANYREMDGFGVHAFKWINAEGKAVYVKTKWESKQGVRTLTPEQSKEIQGEDFGHATRDLFDRIEEGNFPQWTLKVQFIEPQELDAYDFDPLDPTKVWPEEQFPLHTVGTMTLNRNPQNFFAEVEQAAFSPSALVPGIEPSEDKLLQGRLFSYPDTQRHRLGANYLQIPVNCPYAPVRNHQEGGAMNIRTDLPRVNYEPNGYAESPAEDPAYRDSESPLQGPAVRRKIAKTDDFSQAGAQYRSYTPEERDHLISNIVSDLTGLSEDIQLRAVCNFIRADREYGMRLARGLGVDISSFMGGL
ncbi:catalase [Saccharibacillus sp. CPCC 101409]|uniref:catalase n=1 Tax=Saccharibacillus sp. CPCC 101409 TaxID=3058041 RepID=UPI0026741842|nr:catalase [Saccharibacillus sp. CPCC 101409]MDO3413066.1 catalase [Saccharibacillus sp. CPCC 101409]